MALRNQPYIPLYVSDFVTDEKLAQCSASATGVYIRLMCLMHKSEDYGKILLKQKFKQKDSMCYNFAKQVLVYMPYDFDTILSGMSELVDEGVLQIEGDLLIQKRMVKDCKSSEEKAKSGKKGGEKTAEKNKNSATAKSVATPEYEYETSLVESNTNTSIGSIKNKPIPVVQQMIGVYLEAFPKYFRDDEKDFSACFSITQKVENLKGWSRGACMNGKMGEFMLFWREVVDYVKGDDWLSGRSLADLSTREWQRLGQHMSKEPKERKKTKKEEDMTDYQKELLAKREAMKNRKEEA